MLHLLLVLTVLDLAYVSSFWGQNPHRGYDIIFACLIPNSTHLLQPLDVAVFRPVKIEWKCILESWRKESQTRGSIPKSQFPGLLDRLYSQLKPENLVAGFKASGIFPLDRQECLKRVPNGNKDVGGETVQAVFNGCVLDILKKHCAPVTKRTRKRGKKIDVTPGRRVTVADINNKDACPSTSGSAARQDDVEQDDIETVWLKTARWNLLMLNWQVMVTVRLWVTNTKSVNGSLFVMLESELYHTS